MQLFYELQQDPVDSIEREFIGIDYKLQRTFLVPYVRQICVIVSLSHNKILNINRCEQISMSSQQNFNFLCTRKNILKKERGASDDLYCICLSLFFQFPASISYHLQLWYCKWYWSYGIPCYDIGLLKKSNQQCAPVQLSPKGFFPSSHDGMEVWKGRS